MSDCTLGPSVCIRGSPVESGSELGMAPYVLGSYEGFVTSSAGGADGGGPEKCTGFAVPAGPEGL